MVWFEGVEAGSGCTVRGMHLPTCSKGKGLTVLHDPYAQETHDVYASTLCPIERVRQPRVVSLSRPEYALPGLGRDWQRELGGKLYRFHATIMPSGELRTLVQVFTGHPVGPKNLMVAWDLVRLERRSARKRPPCPACDMLHRVIGTCVTCRNLVCRGCEEDVVHLDAPGVYARPHGYHAARWLQVPGTELLFQTAGGTAVRPT